VTFWTFVVMALRVGVVLFFLAAGSFLSFFLAFMVLFLATDIGNGSTYRMIHSVFRTERVREAVHRDEGARTEAALGQKEGSFGIGFVGAIGAYGGFLVSQAYKYSTSTFGEPQAALVTFVGFYVTCMVVTWWFYSRRNTEIPC
jgi:NNP family nitrate/nitrite transporter-like MFS transporter